MQETEGILDKYLESLKDLRDSGIELSDSQLQYIRDSEYEVLGEKDGGVRELTEEGFAGKYKKYSIEKIRERGFKTANEVDTDSLVDIKVDGVIIFSGVVKSTVRKSDWDIVGDDKLNPPEDFCLWIDSINAGWRGKKDYKPFNLYCKQADQWLAQNHNWSDNASLEQKKKFSSEERGRIITNSLYYISKYVKLKEGSVSGGDRKLIPYEAQRIVCYIFDLGLSFAIGKPRQIGETSILGALAGKMAKFHKNFFIKFVTENEDKGLEIFEDKIKYPIYQLPQWQDSSITSDAAGSLVFGLKEGKGKLSGGGGKIKVEAPYPTVINGGTPQIVMIDEAGNIPILTSMINQGRPTMFITENGILKMRRQLIFWGCVCAGTKVWKNDGSLISIENLKQEDGIFGYDGNSATPQTINWFKEPTSKPCYRITTRGGNYLECSDDHPFLLSKNKWSVNGMKAVTYTLAKDIKINDQLITPNEVPVFGNESIADARTIGMLIGDGYYGKYQPQIGSCDREILDYLKSNFNCTQKESKSFVTKSTNKKYEYLTIKGDEILQSLKSAGIYGQTKDEKRLPLNLNRYDKNSVCELLAGLFDTDGNIYENGKRTRIVLTSVVEELLIETKFLLLKLGIHSTITKEYRNKNSKKISENQKDHVFRLYINSHQDIKKFNENIKLLVEYKRFSIEKIAAKNIKSRKSIDCAVFAINSDNDKGAYFNTDFVFDVRYETVSKVEFIGEKPVYNLNCNPSHNYIANGFITAQTGGDMDKGGGAFEAQFRMNLENFRQRKLRTAIIPIFFDAFAKDGMTEEWYNAEKELAYSIKGNDAEKSRTVFHQSYPMSIEEMFLRTAETFIPLATIQKNIERINQLDKTQEPVFGYFEPVFSSVSANPLTSEVLVIGANFVPVSDDQAHFATCQIFQHPQQHWKNRYFCGIDPISTASGSSNFAGAVWDNYANTVSAIVDFRVPNYKECYLQGLLMAIYYGSSHILYESNRGTQFKDFTILKGARNRLVYNASLPQYLQTIQTAEIYGLDNKAKRGQHILFKLQELCDSYLENIWIRRFFDQMKTFIRKEKADDTATFKVQDAKYWKDDVIDAVTFAYICATSFPNIIPINTKEVAVKKKKRMYVLDKYGNLDLQEFMVSER